MIKLISYKPICNKDVHITKKILGPNKIQYTYIPNLHKEHPLNNLWNFVMCNTNSEAIIVLQFNIPDLHCTVHNYVICFIFLQPLAHTLFLHHHDSQLFKTYPDSILWFSTKIDHVQLCLFSTDILFFLLCHGLKLTAQWKFNIFVSQYSDIWNECTILIKIHSLQYTCVVGEQLPFLQIHKEPQ